MNIYLSIMWLVLFHFPMWGLRFSSLPETEQTRGGTQGPETSRSEKTGAHNEQNKLQEPPKGERKHESLHSKNIYCQIDLQSALKPASMRNVHFVPSPHSHVKYHILRTLGVCAMACL